MKIKIEKRLDLPKYSAILIPVISVALSLLIMGIVIWIKTGDFYSVLDAYKEIFTWPFVPDFGLADTLEKMTPLLLAGLGLIIVFQMKIWNIGAEGQIYVGAIATTWGALFLFKDIQNSFVVIPILLIMGTIAGALWAAIPGFLKAFLNLDEIVATLMLNYIAIYWADYYVYGPWKDPKGYNFPLTAIFSKSTWLPDIPGTDIHTGIFIALVAVLVIYIINNKTRWGFDLRIIGDNPKAAQYSGINIKLNIILAMALSGALAGLAGSVHMLGVQHRLQHGFSPGYGYTAIIIAWLARLNPWATIIVAFLFGGLMVGGEQLQIILRIPLAMIHVLEGLILLTLLSTEVLFRYKITIVKDGR